MQPEGRTKIRAAGGNLPDLCLTAFQNEKVGNTSGDEFDPWIAWYLAYCWLNESRGSPVMLLENAEHGSFLLPQDEMLRDKFAKFIGNASC